jgi:hypothetical protein
MWLKYNSAQSGATMTASDNGRPVVGGEDFTYFLSKLMRPYSETCNIQFLLAWIHMYVNSENSADTRGCMIREMQIYINVLTYNFLYVVPLNGKPILACIVGLAPFPPMT